MANTKIPAELSSTPGIIDNSNATAITIDSSENVGIGTTSPDRKLHLNEAASGTSNFIHLTTADTGTTGSNGFLIGIGSSGGAELWNYEAQPISFATSSAERMRIDSSGNLLVGKTSTNTDSVGFEARATGLNAMVRASGETLILGRNTSHGSILSFRKDGTAIGSISTFDGEVSFGRSSVGIMPVGSSTAPRVIPTNHDSNVIRDAAIDLGYSNARFKDLYLSGGVNFSANANASGMSSEVLDDYEEGSWTPSFSGATLSSATGFYTKIGDQVTVHYHIVTTGGLPGSQSQVRINDLPFSSAGNNVGAGSQYVAPYNVSNSSLGSIVQSNNDYIRFININTGSYDYLLMGELEVSANNSIALIGTFTYRT